MLQMITMNVFSFDKEMPLVFRRRRGIIGFFGYVFRNRRIIS